MRGDGTVDAGHEFREKVLKSLRTTIFAEPGDRTATLKDRRGKLRDRLRKALRKEVTEVETHLGLHVASMNLLRRLNAYRGLTRGISFPSLSKRSPRKP